MIYLTEKREPIKITKILKGIEVEKYFQFIKENYIKESPQELFNRASISDRYDSPELNQYAKEQFLKSGAKKEGEFKIYNHTYDLYQKTEDDIIYYVLMDTDYIILIYDVCPINIKNSNGIESLNVIQSRIGDRSGWLHLANEFVFDFLLKHYDFIMSDKTHTGNGRTFWKGLLIRAIGKLFCYGYDPKNNLKVVISNINQFDVFYKEENENFRFIISNKEFSV